MVIPALNEEAALPGVLREIPSPPVRRVVVADNGSSDRTADFARECGAEVVTESERGYGAACLKALAHLSADPPDVVVFLDGDYSDHPDEIRIVVGPIARGEADLVIGGVGDVPGHRGIRCEPWRQINHVFVAAPDHPLCQERSPISLGAVRQYRAVIISDTSRNSAPLSRGLLNQQTAIYVPTMEAKVEAHRQGIGVGYVPQSCVSADVANGTLVALTLAETRADGPAQLGWKADNRGQALLFLLQRLREARGTCNPGSGGINP